jgi:hypothetical protein
LWLTPVTPFDPNTARPQNLQITIPVKLERYERMGNSGRFITLFEEQYAFAVPLPRTPTDLGWDNYHDVKFTGVPHTLTLETAQTRALYHSGLTTKRRMEIYPDGRRYQYIYPETLEHMRQTIYWWQAASEEARRTGNRIAAGNFRQNADSTQQEYERAKQLPLYRQ